MEILISWTIFLIVVITIIKNKNKDKDKINAEDIISNGTLFSSNEFKGEVFYKSATIDGKDNLYFYSHIRLNNGTDIVVNNQDIYRKFYIGTHIKIIEKIYFYKKQRLNLYLAELDSFNNIRVYENIDTIK